MENDTIVPFKGNVFRKLYSTQSDRVLLYQLREKKLIDYLQSYEHPNVVTFYQVTDRYVDMEYLDPLESQDTLKRIVPVMETVKTFLQGIGVIYMDWKLDNIAKGKHGYTLFDFDCSGMVEKDDVHLLDTEIEWKVEPSGWSYEQSKRVCATPKEMDDWSFVYNLVNPSLQTSLQSSLQSSIQSSIQTSLQTSFNPFDDPEYPPSTNETNIDALETHTVFENVD